VWLGCDSRILGQDTYESILLRPLQFFVRLFQMKVDGKRFGRGKYQLIRDTAGFHIYSTTPTYILDITDKLTILENKKDVTEEIRHLEFKTPDVVFIWRKPCKIGLPFKATIYNGE